MTLNQVFLETRHAAASVKAALEATRPGRVVFLSTVGAHVAEPNLLNNSKMMEEMLRSVPVPVAFLRAAWFMENAAWDVPAAKSGMISSLLQPLDHVIPMVATSDIAQVASQLLVEAWTGIRVVELEGPRRYSANDIAAAFSSVLGRKVHTEAIPRGDWEKLFRSQGMRHPEPRIRMIDGFNEGWVDFERGSAESRKGVTTLDEVLRTIVENPIG